MIESLLALFDVEIEKMRLSGMRLFVRVNDRDDSGRSKCIGQYRGYCVTEAFSRLRELYHNNFSGQLNR
jgi:hypothetical protein